jgi:osmotically-inducible protein OsmY
VGRAPETAPPASDAMLAQLVRGALGRRGRTGGRPKVNVSSCGFVVTLHGRVEDDEEADGILARVRAVPGVRGVVNRLNTR